MGFKYSIKVVVRILVVISVVVMVKLSLGGGGTEGAGGIAGAVGGGAGAGLTHQRVLKPREATVTAHTAPAPTPDINTCSQRRLSLYRNRCDHLRQSPPSQLGPGKLRGLYKHNDLMHLTEEELQRVTQNIVVDDRHELLYCSIPKAGCTTWKHYLLQNLPTKYDPSEPENKIHYDTLAAERGIPFLRTFNRSEILRRLDSHFKLIVVRHPLDRFVSGYAEKFRGHKRYYKEHAGVRIIKQFRRNPSERALKFGDDLTFEEFIRYVVDQQKTHEFVDNHWENYEKVCFPCAIGYDMIAKLETNTRDSEYVIDTFLEGIHYDKRPIKNQNRNMTNGDWGRGKELELYSNITDGLFKDLLQFYDEDMRMFGYMVERDGKTIAKCQNGDECC